MSSGLASRALRGLGWNYVGTMGRIVATFVSQIILARLLGPEPFGLFAYAFLTITLLVVLVEMGMQMALEQTATLEDRTVAIACARLLLAGAVAASCVVTFADAIALHVFAAPQAAPVLRAMAPTLIVSALTVAATAMLSRDIEFKLIQLAALGSYLVGYLGVGVAAALAGLGVWSLVLAWHVQTLVACGMLVACSPRSLRPGNPFARLAIAEFGAVVMVTNVVNWLTDNGPHVAIGRWLGASMLGTFTVANNLVKAPVDHLLRNLQAVLFPLAARAQGNDVGLRRAYLTVLAGVGVLSLPAFAFVASMAHPIVLLLLGSQWLAAVDVLVPLALAMVFRAGESMCGPILCGRGEPRAELHLQALTLVVMLAVLAGTAWFSLAAVAWGVAFVFLVRCALMNAAVTRRLKIALSTFAATLIGPLLLGGIGWGALAGIGAGLGGAAAPLPALGVLAAAAAATLLAVGVALAAMPQIVLGPYLLALLDRLFERRPELARQPGLRHVAELSGSAARRVAEAPDGVAMPWTRRRRR